MSSNLLSLVLFVVCAGAALSQTAPVISTPPANQPVKAGQTATFSVVASGSSPLSYQWYRNGVKIAGATETSYRISSAGISDVGQYTVRVANAYGAVWSGSVQGQVATAGPTSYFLGLDNSLYTMGENLQFQQTDQLYKQIAVPTVIATDVARVAAGFWEVHFIKTDGTLWGVGRNRGAFGLPTTSSTKHKTTPYLIESNVVESSIGNAGAGVSTHALYLKSDGTLWGMGQNSQGQLGDRSNTRRDSPIQIATGVRSIATGTNHSMFLTNDGTVWLMGDNSSGQLGDGTTISRNEPFKLRGGVAQIACAGNSSYLVTVDGALFSWGANQNGQLGLGDTQPRVTPVQLVATGVLEVFAGGHSYGYDPYCSAGFLRDDGMVYVMGYNGGGQLGDGSKIQRNAPVSVASGISSVAFGFFDYAHALFVSSSGNLLGSGVSDRGQLGRGFTNYAQEPRLFLSSGVDKKRISTGQFGGAFYINAKNELFACGGNGYGALGLGDAVPRPNWTKVADDVWGVSSGNADVVWWKNDANKSLYGAGFNITPGNKTPILLATQVESASWGSDFGCYIKSDKALWMLSSNAGGREIRKFGFSTDEPLDTDVIEVRVNQGIVAYRKSDGSIWLNGAMYPFGIILTPTTSSLTQSYSTPRPSVKMDVNVKSIVTGPDNDPIFYIKNDNSLWSVGFFPYAVSIAEGISPRKVADNVAWASAGPYSLIWSTMDGKMWVLGQNTGGGRLFSKSDYIMLPGEQVTSGYVDGRSSADQNILLKADGSLWQMGRVIGDGDQPGRLPDPVVPTELAGRLSSGRVSQLWLIPEISSQPQSQAVAAGGTVNLSVTAGGSPTPAFQWRKNGVPISGATNAGYAIANTTIADEGRYDVLISNPGGSVVSALATVAVVSPPKFTSQPESQVMSLSGSEVTLEVVVEGRPAPDLQWFFNGQPIETGPTLYIGDFQPQNVGRYWVVATNSAGSVTSSVASLEILYTGNYAQHSISVAGYVPGQPITVSNTINFTGTPSALSWSVLLPAGWSFASSTASGFSRGPTAGQQDLIEWTWATVPANPLRFSYNLNVPAGQSGSKELVAINGITAGAAIRLLAKPDPLVVSQITRHSADLDQNGQISLTELTRVIELYNTRTGTTRTGSYVVATTTTDDGFASDSSRSSSATVTLARYHSGDSNRDGRISLTELTRVIELYNYRSGTTRTGQYKPQAGTEDGFAPGP